jgi:tetratricopeptide (TPR) repeat protein
MAHDNDHHNVSRARNRRKVVAFSLVMVCGFACVIGLSRWIDARRPPVDVALEEEKLYATGETAKRISLGFNGLIADWYWMRTLQYVGRKIVRFQDADIPLDDLRVLNLTLLYPLLDTTTTLDPQFIAAYEYGGVVLPAINDDDAIKLLRKGIAANPHEWRLHKHLGYIYWKRGDYQTAAVIYRDGAKVPGAPNWMTAMEARLVAEGGSRDTAREMYRRMAEETTDAKVKDLAERRLLQIDSFDERDAIRIALSKSSQRMGRCSNSWKDSFAELRAVRTQKGKELRIEVSSGAPLDPADIPYRLVSGGCDVDLDWTSRVPYK